MGEEIIRLSASQTLRVISSGPDSLELESTWTTSPKPPPVHWHPHQVELFEVLEGQRTEEMLRFIERGTGGLRGLRLLWTFRDEYRLGGAMGGP